jgi:RNA polymerase sigma factor (sigma-70 family)
MDDASLLKDYVDTGSQEAFGQLVSRHINFVFAAALRNVHDRHVAEEITQAVFIVLARKASTLRHEAVLSSWLLSTCRYASLGHMKMAARRKRHERRAAEMAKTVWEEEVETQWPQYEGDLDAALASLREADRKAVMLRFYEHKSFDEIATILGTAEEAARKRVSRAVEKLRGYFGVSTRTLPATAISYYLYNKLTVQAPLALASKIATTATAVADGAIAAPASAQIADHVVQHLFIAKVKCASAAIAAVLAVSIGAGILVYASMGDRTQPAPTRPHPANFIDR